jgi:hypothetical protein
MSLLKLAKKSGMARLAAICLLAAIIAGVASFFATARSMRASQSSGSVLTSVPFRAVLVHRQYAPDGTLGAMASEDYLRFSDGSFAKVNAQGILPERRQLMSSATDLRLEQHLLIEPTTRSVVTFKQSLRDLISSIKGQWEESCPGKDDNIEKTEPGEAFFGYPTIHVTNRFDEDWKEDRWMIPQLRCFSVKETDVFGPSRDELIVTSLVVGEPPRSALSAPEGYTERSPAELVKEYAIANGGEQLFDARGLKKFTQDYEAGRK